MDHVQNTLIGDSSVALNAARLFAEKHGYTALVMCNDVSGAAAEIGEKFATCLEWIRSASDKVPQAITELIPSEQLQKLLHTVERGLNFCLIWGGETTVQVRGSGVGGRCQELALSFLLRLARSEGRLSRFGGKFEFLAAGTDGQDGPTDAAGAVISDSDLAEYCTGGSQIDGEQYLRENDSYRFFEKFRNGRCHVKTGVTGTNVMDVMMLAIQFRSSGARL